MSPVYPPSSPEVPQGLLIMGVLTADLDLEKAAITELERLYGPVAAQSGSFDFDWTDYYAPEMGERLVRRYVAFDRLIVEDEIVEIKHVTAGMEARFADEGHRRVNLDPGYLDYHKVVLASWKTGKHKIYLTKGVWADPVLIYETGAFHTQDWTFPDLRTNLYESFFLEARRVFKTAMRRAMRAQNKGAPDGSDESQGGA